MNTRNVSPSHHKGGNNSKEILLAAGGEQIISSKRINNKSSKTGNPKKKKKIPSFSMQSSSFSSSSKAYVWLERNGGWLCVAFVWMFCLLTLVSLWHFVFIPFMMYASMPPLLLIIFWHATLFMCLLCYAKTTATEPGYVDPNWVQPLLICAFSQTFLRFLKFLLVVISICSLS